MFLAKVVREAKNETFMNEIFLWELDKEVSECRDCRKPFGVVARRHHCRNCGGIFCDECTIVNADIMGVKMDRCCKGCVRGETPGENVRLAIENALSTMDTRGNRKISCRNMSITYGSPFESAVGSSTKSSSGPEAPTSGYFEFYNKLNLFCCIKVVSGLDGTEVATLWEVARPSYTAVPPNSLVCGRFDPTLPNLELMVLMGNPVMSETGAGGEAVYDTVQSPGKISKCAQVGNFRRYIVFRIECTDRNVMLKFKGDVALEPRQGNSIARVGIFGKLGMKSDPAEAKSMINFDTNVAPTAIKVLGGSNI
jgi:hypothetical protein